MDVASAVFNLGKLKAVMQTDLFLSPLMEYHKHEPLECASMVMRLEPTHRTVREAKVYARRALRSLEGGYRHEA